MCYFLYLKANLCLEMLKDSKSMFVSWNYLKFWTFSVESGNLSGTASNLEAGLQRLCLAEEFPGLFTLRHFTLHPELTSAIYGIKKYLRISKRSHSNLSLWSTLGKKENRVYWLKEWEVNNMIVKLLWFYTVASIQNRWFPHLCYEMTYFE